MPRPSATNVTRVAVSTTVATILAANGRRGFTIYNDSGQILYVKLGTGASATSKSFAIAVGGQYISDPWIEYCGVVTAIMAGGTTGNVDVTEHVA